MEWQLVIDIQYGMIMENKTTLHKISQRQVLSMSIMMKQLLLGMKMRLYLRCYVKMLNP